MPNYTATVRNGANRKVVSLLDFTGSDVMPLRTAKGIAGKVGVHLDLPVIVCQAGSSEEVWRYTGPAVEAADD